MDKRELNKIVVIMLLLSGLFSSACGPAGIPADASLPPLPKPETQPTSPSADMLTPGPLGIPPDFYTSIKAFGAVGDGVTDDKEAIRAALRHKRVDENGDWSGDYLGAYFNGRPSSLYFPAGTYFVSDTLEWAGCCMTLQGQGSGASIFKLVDNAPDFDDSENPKPVIENLIGAGNDSFRQNI